MVEIINPPHGTLDPLQNLIDKDYMMPPGLSAPVDPDPSILNKDPPTLLQDEEMLNLNVSRELLPDLDDEDPNVPTDQQPPPPRDLQEQLLPLHGDQQQQQQQKKLQPLPVEDPQPLRDNLNTPPPSL